MVKRLILLCCFTFFSAMNAYSADIIQVYNAALVNDPTYRERLDQALSDQQNLASAIANILPNINASYNPSITRSGFTGSLYAPFSATTSLAPRNTTTEAATLALTLTQPLFDFARFSAVAGAYEDSKRAISTTYAALQDLIVRMGKAYFDVLEDEEIVSYTQQSVQAYKRQLGQQRERHRVGLSSVTEVHTAETSYRLSISTYLAAKVQLVNDREILRVITGRTYRKLARLSEHFPLVTPSPQNVEVWLQKALKQNWSIIASRYKVESAKRIIQQQEAGHLPTLDLQGQVDRTYINNINSYNSLNSRSGPGSQSDRRVQLVLNVPIFSGGLVTSQTRQAYYNMRVAYDQLQAATHDAIRKTEQSYQTIVISIDKIKQNRAAISASKLSLEGVEVSYKVGTATLIDVLNEQQKVLDAQTRYARDRYEFVNNILILKEAAGTLCVRDLIAINQWLIHKE